MRSPRHLLCAIVLSLLVGCGGGARQNCVETTPSMAGEGPGFELLDFGRREAWATRDWTKSGFDAFELPATWWFWRKNEPRALLADGGRFLRSPGCPEGRYSYMTAFDREFLHVVRFHALGAVDDRASGLRGVELEKYHRLSYRVGQEVTVLSDPSGRRFIGVTRTFPPPDVGPTIPDGWQLAVHRLSEGVEVDLSGRVTVLRADNEDSFQGPLPAGLKF